MTKRETDKRLDAILEALEKTASLDVTSKLELSNNSDQIDAIAAGINMLNEELVSKLSEISSVGHKYFKLYNNSPDMMLSIEPELGKIIECNQTLADKTGYLKEEIIGQTIFFLYHPDCMSGVKQAFQSFIKTGNVTNAELELRKKDGTKITVLLNVEAIRDEQGIILYSNSTWRDVSEMKIINSIIFDQEKDRESIAEYLHEDLAQILAGVSYHLEVIKSKLEKNADPDLMRMLVSTKDYIFQSMESTKQLANDLMPRIMMNYGLVPALRNYTIQEKKKSGLNIEFRTNTSKTEIDKEIEITVFRTVVAIINIVKASLLTNIIMLDLSHDKSGLQVSIDLPIQHDLSPDQDLKYLNSNLTSFQKRVELIGGHMEITKDKTQERIIISIICRSTTTINT